MDTLIKITRIDVITNNTGGHVNLWFEKRNSLHTLSVDPDMMPAALREALINWMEGNR